LPKFTQSVIDAAQAAAKEYKVFASVSLAQYALESGWGAKMSGKNNPFGIKAKKGEPSTVVTTHEVIKGQRVKIDAAFRDFNTMEEAFMAHAKLLATAPIYKAAMACKDPLSFADALVGKYATDPNYGKTLKSIITHSGLRQYDV